MIARIPLLQLPTPCHHLARASKILGVDLWIKRDDLTGFAYGGNKGRKLEFLMPTLVAQKAKIVVTCGATQSNFIRQLGAACACLDIECHAVTMHRPYPEGRPPGVPALPQKGGNMHLGGMANVQYHVIPDGDWNVLEASAREMVTDFGGSREGVVEMPLGGSSPLGAYSFLLAGQELGGQLSDMDVVVTASSSGSTQAGLSMAFHGSDTRVIGISADPEPEIIDDLVALSVGLGETIGKEGLRAENFEFCLDYVGDGYGIPSEAGNRAIRWLAQTEGIFLDPIYSGKAFAGLIDLAKRQELTGRVVFWHTGGLPGLFVHE